MTPSQFDKEFVGRVRALRKDMGLTAEAMADLMGCSKDAWNKYETRTPLPHHLVVKFCQITRMSIWYLFTGELAGKDQLAIQYHQLMGNNSEKV